MSNCPNLARTVAIGVRFSLNFSVVFDFIYFRFRPSKAKWIGNVLPNRLNAANYLQRFFLLLILFAASFRRGDRHCCTLDMYVQVHCGWIAASILKKEHYCLRNYTDATMRLAPVGKAQQYGSVFNFQLVFRGLFLQFAAQCLRTQTDSVRQ